jgi:hypothetical protein
MNRILLIAALVVGTTSSAFDLSKFAGCRKLTSWSDVPAGFTVYSCPHPFIKASSDGKSTTRTVNGLTNCVDKTILFYEVYPEVLEHEFRHASRCGTEMPD